nr:MAG TPA: hypothetical protein [Bacteriophage sp.]DAU51034.1 MAG TPA: hypothetical protein [Caudoviricetes sp.]
MARFASISFNFPYRCNCNISESLLAVLPGLSTSRKPAGGRKPKSTRLGRSG